MGIMFGIAALAATVASTAPPAPSHLSDAAYLEAARCVGWASSKKMEQPDATAMKDWLKAESVGRPQFLVDQADDAEQQAQGAADRANDKGKAKLQAELSGECATLRG
jgi:hypothetical protein